MGVVSPLFQLVHGIRGCYSAPEFGGDPGTQAQCQSLLDLGGWGTSALGEINSGEWIPNKNVSLYNNIFYNPAGATTHYTQFVANGEINPPAQTQNIPNPSMTDDQVFIKGNIIWNFPQEYTGMIGSNNGSTPACLPASTCDTVNLIADNYINQFEPQLIDVGLNNYRPLAAGNVFSANTQSIPDFTWVDAPAAPAVPAGTLTNYITIDFDLKTRAGINPPGAFCTSTAGIKNYDYFEQPDVSVFPNPFSGSTTLNLTLKKAGRVKVELHDLYGRIIETIENDSRPAGKYNIPLNLNSCNTSISKSGIYFCSVQFNDQPPVIIKVVVMK
jgi:hypothetical protein